MLGKVLLFVVAAVGGIYLSSPEGKNARIALLRRKAAFTPLIRDLLDQAKAVLEGSRELDSVALRANIEKVVSEVKISLSSIDFDAAIETVREAIRVTARKLRDAEAELTSAKKGALTKTQASTKLTKTTATRATKVKAKNGK